jgi:chromosome segregation ATPase
MVKDLKREIHDMSEKIFELQAKTEHLTNGQRYAAINEIEKSIAPLRKDLHHLEYKLYNQQHSDEEVSKEIDYILDQISELAKLKSDLTKRINTENESTRKYYHNEVMKFMREEMTPLRESIKKNDSDLTNFKEEIKEEIIKLKFDLNEADKERQLKEAERFDQLKMIITAVVAVLGGISALALYFQPAIQTIVRILFGI